MVGVLPSGHPRLRPFESFKRPRNRSVMQPVRPQYHAPLDNAVASFLQAPRNISTSASVVAQPRLTRTAPRVSAGETPMAARTWEGCTLPDEQAAPDDTAIPSRSKAITAVSAFMPSSGEQGGIGQPLGVCAENHRLRRDRLETGFERIPQAPHVRGLGVAVARAPRQRPRRKPAMPATFSVPARSPRSWPPPRMSGSGKWISSLRANQRADALRAADLVRRKRQQIGAERADIAGDAPGRLHRIDMQQAAGGVDDGGGLRDRLRSRRSRYWRASARPAAAAIWPTAAASAARSIRPVAVDRDLLDRLAAETGRRRAPRHARSPT